MKRRGGTALPMLFVSIVVGASLGGCSSVPSIDAYASVRADLDSQTHTMRLPLDAFSASTQDSHLIEQANALTVKQCMARFGLPYPRAEESWATKPPVQDRFFGIWTEQQAASYGYDLPPNDDSNRIDQEEQAFPDSWWQTWDQCIREVDQLPLMEPGASAAPTSVDEGILDSMRNAMGDPKWKGLSSEWRKCLTAVGVATTQDSVVPVLPPEKQAQVEIAIKDVDCKLQLDMPQQLADLLARYQSAYIASHEAPLQEYRAEVDKVVEKAREIVQSIA